MTAANRPHKSLHPFKANDEVSADKAIHIDCFIQPLYIKYGQIYDFDFILSCRSWPGLTTDFTSVDMDEVFDILKINKKERVGFIKLTRYG